MSKSTVSPERVAAMAEVLREQAITRDEAESAGMFAAWAPGTLDWGLSVDSTGVVAVARTRVRRDSVEGAVADGVALRRALLEAAGVSDARGFVAADTVNDGDCVVVGWLGAVKVVVEFDR